MSQKILKLMQENLNYRLIKPVHKECNIHYQGVRLWPWQQFRGGK